MTKMQSQAELKKTRATCLSALDKQKKRVYVCAGTGCISSGSLKIFDKLRKSAVRRGLSVEIALSGDGAGADLGLKRSGCHGFCQTGPLLRIEPSGYVYTQVNPDDADEIIEKSIVGDEFIARLGYRNEAGRLCKCERDIPFYKRQARTVLEHSGAIDALDMREYLAAGGYKALEKALFEMTPEAVVSEVKESNLRGRGGGGFQTGRKWEQVARQSEPQKYIVCNGDEGDPGAFMDMSIMEGDPHRMIEGMLIAAYACGADTGYIYVRAEYPKAVERLETAIAQGKKAGLLGKNILGTGFNFDLRISQGAGAFVCGEGSALTSSIEGNRGMPRVKPPRTVEQGLFGKPTVLNNVETFANVPLIIEKGAAWYRSLGTENSPGTKAFSVTGNIANTGLIEVEMGSPL
ncbi:MAG: NAD(P)H-dependent oxidoreductase subunit E, partial [Clostridiales Family XIII bacterium]|nr:NAD(P)H-dependent oxidoreductase subunit E [Clostridiales Family XIII bacterium]